MQIRQILKEDNAVSPVIGVILMVAITVILAAVIATFVLGLGDQVSNTAPQASFGTDYDGSADTLTVTHDGGDSIKASELYVRGGSSSGDWTSSGVGSYADSEMISAGSSVTFSVTSSDTVRVVYEAEEGGNSATLHKWEGPDA